MVGINLGLFKEAARRFHALSGAMRIVLLAAAVALAFGLGSAMMTATMEARLLRADPDVAAADATLTHFAYGRGHDVYQSHCASCHGAEGRGDTVKGVPDLTDKDWLYGEGKASDIETIVLYGVRAPNSKTWRLADMPAYARRQPYAREPAIQPLSPGDIRDVVQYLGAIRGQSRPADAVQRGAAIFSNRGGCYDCHGSDARGDPAVGGPNLADNIWLYGGGDASVANSIAHGRAGFCPGWFDRLRPAKIREATLYVYALSHPTPTPASRTPS